MGFFWEGLPPYVLSWARQMLPGTVAAVETGTFRGDTSALLNEYFGSCVTIERSPAFAQTARARFALVPSIRVLEGTSSEVLAQALPDAQLSCFIWLDAHGMYDYIGSSTEENPLLSELDTIFAARSSTNTIIAIDDARGLGTQPGWPSIGQVCSAMQANGFQTICIDDCLIAASTDLDADFWNLYQQSRMVEVSALFHVWRAVKRSVRIRQRLDSLLSKRS